MINKTTIIGAVAVIALAVGLIALLKSPTTTPPFGAISGVDNLQPCWSDGGVRFCAVSVTMTATSSEPCVFPKLASLGIGTSSLLAFVATFSSTTNNGIGIAAQTFDLSTTTGVGGFGSSTPAYIKEFSLAANTLTQVVWQPFATSSIARLIGADSYRGYSQNFIDPQSQLTWRIATATPGTFAGGYYQGVCKAVFMATNF